MKKTCLVGSEPQSTRSGIVPGGSDNRVVAGNFFKSGIRPNKIGVAAAVGKHRPFARCQDAGCGKIGGLDLENAFIIGGPFPAFAIHNDVGHRHGTVDRGTPRDLQSGFLGNIFVEKKEKNCNGKRRRAAEKKTIHHYI